MSRAFDADLTAEQNGRVAVRIREELAKRRISRQRLADDARVSLSTLEKALAGSRPFTLGTLIRIEQALGVSLRAPDGASSTAPDSLGAYSHLAAAWLEGEYLTLRPSFERPGAVYAYRTGIGWDEAASCLAFSESARLDAAFTQKGQVALPTLSGHVHLVTNEHGQHRLITLGRPTIQGELFGLLSTLHAGPGGHLNPVAAPIVLTPLRLWPEARFGAIAPGDDLYDAYRGRLARAVEEGFLRLVGL